VAGLKVGHVLSTVDSTATPRSAVESANLDAAIGGFPIPVDQQGALGPDQRPLHAERPRIAARIHTLG